jgi:hypothetical protein
LLLDNDRSVFKDTKRELLKKARQSAVGEDPAFRLAVRAVGHFIGLEGDSCQSVAAGKGTGFAEAAVHRESTAKA